MTKTRDQFFKYEALGNDMIVFDPARVDLALDLETIRLLCDRNRGIGADGICYGPLLDAVDAPTMRFFNPDGTEAEKSGNGLRIFARYLIDAGYVDSHQQEFRIGIGDELLAVKRLDATGQYLALTMGHLSFWSQDLPMTGPHRQVINEMLTAGNRQLRITAVSVGNPHCVLIDCDRQQIHTLGPLLENADLFPNRTNVQIVQVIDENSIRIAIWERGAGYTLASGTSACATAGAAIRNQICKSPVNVIMDGGDALVQIDDDWQVTLSGEVHSLFSCELGTDLLIRLTQKEQAKYR